MSPMYLGAGVSENNSGFSSGDRAQLPSLSCNDCTEEPVPDWPDDFYTFIRCFDDSRYSPKKIGRIESDGCRLPVDG